MSETNKKIMNPAIKAVLVLVLIAFVSSALLSILNNVLYISDKERTDRALQKVYNSASFDPIEIDVKFATKDGAEIIALFKADDGTIVVQSRGAVGYKGRTEIMLAIGVDGEILNLVVSTYGGDDKTTSIKPKYLKAAYFGQNVLDNPIFTMTPTNATNEVDVSAGATSKKTMRSICSAVNMAVSYINEANVLAGGAK